MSTIEVVRHGILIMETYYVYLSGSEKIWLPDLWCNFLTRIITKKLAPGNWFFLIPYTRTQKPILVFLISYMRAHEELKNHTGKLIYMHVI